MPSIEFTRKRTSSRKRRRFWYRVIALLVAGTAFGIVVWPHAVNRYNRWSAHRYARKAAECIVRGDSRNALLNARVALEKNPLDVEATRAMAQALGALGSPEAEPWRARLGALQPGDAENALARADAALKNGRVEEAGRFVDSLAPGDRKSAAFHAIAAKIAMQKQDTASAESHWMEAARLEPGESRHRLSLAGLHLESADSGVREAAFNELQAMRAKPPASLEALRLLLAHALKTREATMAQEMADALVADPRSTFNDKLTRLAVLLAIHDPRSGAYLLELRDMAVREPATFSVLLSWMNNNDLPMMVAEWVPVLPPDLVSKPPVCLAVAEAYSKAADWEKLRKLTETTTWAESDYLRRVFLVRALEHLGEEDEAAQEWTQAVAASRLSPQSLERLAKIAATWKWDRRAEEILWMLAAGPQCPRWAADSLWKICLERGETARLHKLSAIIAKWDPKGIATRNNYAFLSLLIRSDEGNPHQVAEALHREHPEDVRLASTYGLSLYQQGKAEDAVAVMSALSPEELRRPQVALYYAVFLIGAGHADRAEEYVKLAAGSPMLPEEKALLDRVKVATQEAEEAKIKSTVPAVPAGGN